MSYELDAYNSACRARIAASDAVRSAESAMRFAKQALAEADAALDAITLVMQQRSS